MAQFNFFDRSRAKSAVHHKSELTGNGYIGRDLAKSEQIDVLLSMQSGAKLLKLCSRRTRSHWRKFQLDSSNCSINWVSNNKKNIEDTTIQITNIIEIICFNKNIVDKFKDTLPETYNIFSDELQNQQFTIKYIESNKHIPKLSSNHSTSFITHSNSNHSRNRSGSFINKFKSNNEHEHKYNNNNNNNNNNNIQELHLMAENVKQANIWIYGLQSLVDASKSNVDLINLCHIPFQYNKFKISYSKLYEYNNNNNDSILSQQFKLRLDHINISLYSVVDKLPQSQQLLLEDRKIKTFETDSYQINYLMKKIRKDQNDLDHILHQISKGRFSKINLKEWGYILTRIEINIGGYKIAISNGNNNNCNNYNNYNHKRERSKSSSYPSLQQQQYSAKNKNNILKDRSPRSPFSSDHNHQILRPPNSPQGMEKYDSI